jgi:hypothetical protein
MIGINPIMRSITTILTRVANKMADAHTSIYVLIPP